MQNGISNIVNLLSRGLLNRSVLFDVANVTTLAFTVCVFLTLVVVNSPLSIIRKRSRSGGGVKPCFELFGIVFTICSQKTHFDFIIYALYFFVQLISIHYWHSDIKDKCIIVIRFESNQSSSRIVKCIYFKPIIF